MMEADFESLLEADFEMDEFDEAVFRRPRARAVSVATSLPIPPRGNATVQQPQQGVATKAELDATARRLDDRIATVSTSVKALDTRTQSTNRELETVSGALRREIAVRKKQNAELRQTVDESRQIAMIMPLIGGGNDSFSKMLPIMLYGGMLGGGTTSSGGSDNNAMMMTMMMALVMSQGSTV